MITAIITTIINLPLTFLIGSSFLMTTFFGDVTPLTDVTTVLPPALSGLFWTEDCASSPFAGFVAEEARVAKVSDIGATVAFWMVTAPSTGFWLMTFASFFKESVSFSSEAEHGEVFVAGGVGMATTLCGTWFGFRWKKTQWGFWHPPGWVSQKHGVCALFFCQQRVTLNNALRVST